MKKIMILVIVALVLTSCVYGGIGIGTDGIHGGIGIGF